MEKKNVALLCDYGLDDAIATVYLLMHAKQFGRIDILPIAGNFPLAASHINAQRLLSNMEVLPEHVRIVDTAAIEQNEEHLPDIHGKDGMADVLPAAFEPKVPVITYEQWIPEVDSSYVIVSLGPCTVTLDLLKRVGQLPLILMAGNIAEPPNFHGYEFNHGMDIPAFAACVKYPHVCATLDTCHVPKCDLMQLSLPTEGLLAKLLAGCLALSRGRGEQLCCAYDLTAVVYLLHPERFCTEEAPDPDGNRITLLRYISEEPIV